MGKKKETCIDAGKIIALWDAGWPIREIAAEMKMESQEVKMALLRRQEIKKNAGGMVYAEPNY